MLVNKKDFIDTYTIKAFGEKFAQDNPEWFAIYPTPTLAAVVADTMTDGHIGQNMVIFFSKERKETEKFIERITSLFDVKYKIKEVTTNPGMNGAFVFSGPLTRLLNLCGAPCGNKVMISFDVPPWVKQGDTE